MKVSNNSKKVLIMTVNVIDIRLGVWYETPYMSKSFGAVQY